jgi:hypothetical protein
MIILFGSYIEEIAFQAIRKSVVGASPFCEVLENG